MERSDFDTDKSRPLSLRVFFSYSYKDSEELKPVFRQVCESAGFLPVFADEITEIRKSTAWKIRVSILSCDLVMVVVARPMSSSLFFEMGSAAMIGKPVFVFADLRAFRQGGIPRELQGFRIIVFRSKKELSTSLSDALLKFRVSLGPEYIKIKKDENRISEVLQKSLEKNVLVLGKDSDEEGLEKMNRIANVLRKSGYEPVMLRKLPEISYLSLEDKMIRVGGLCRFVMAEDSRPSGTIDEVRLCANCQYVTATLREAGVGSTWMQAHYPQTFRFINRFCYRSMKDPTITKDNLCDSIYSTLEAATSEAILWAESRIAEQRQSFRKVIYSNL